MKQSDWRERFDEQWHSFDQYGIYGKDGRMVLDENYNHFEAIKNFISQELDQARQEEREKVFELLKQSRGYHCENPDCDHNLDQAIAVLESKSTD